MTSVVAGGRLSVVLVRVPARVGGRCAGWRVGLVGVT